MYIKNKKNKSLKGTFIDKKDYCEYNKKKY